MAQTDGKVLLGGSFTSVNNAVRKRIARLNADGVLDSGFQAELSGKYPRVSSLAVQRDGKLLVGGSFTSVNGTNSAGIARLHEDGTLDTEFRSAIPGAISSIAIQSDGKMLLAGENIQPYRVNADGTWDTGFVNESGLPSCGGGPPTSSVAVQADGRIIMGVGCGEPDFASYPVSRLSGDGTLDDAFQVETSGEYGTTVSVIALQSDGKALIGGTFTAVNGVSRNGIARLNADGSLDDSFQNGLGGTWDVRSIALQHDGKVLIAGGFTAVNGVPAAGIARIWGSADIPPRINSLNRNGVEVNLSWDALPNRTYRVQYNESLSADTWSDLAGDVSGPITGTASKTDTAIGNTGQRFYRIKLLP